MLKNTEWHKLRRDNNDMIAWEENEGFSHHNAYLTYVHCENKR